MKKFLKLLLLSFFTIIGLAITGLVAFNAYYAYLNSKAKSDLVEKNVLTIDGFTFRDLNNNNQLDIYEDSRQHIDSRIDDLIQQMNIAEKVGLMWHPFIGTGVNGNLAPKPNPSTMSMVSTYDVVLNKKLRHFNLFQIPELENLALWYNNIQKLAEQDRLGIPITISSDPRHGTKNFLSDLNNSSGFSKWPEPLGLAATNDSLLVVEFGRIAAKELSAVGIRTALHPMADLATEPRWSRISGTFGEDADLSTKIMAAYIYGFQGSEMGVNSVACMTKHWPGGGPQEDGWDSHFRYGMNQVYPGNNFEYHIKPFLAAFEAGTAMVMPYYSIPVDQTSENVAMAFNKEIITEQLRNKYGYDGIVCSDWTVLGPMKILGMKVIGGMTWGVDEFSLKERIQKAINAGIDQFGGNSLTGELLDLVNDNTISESRIDESVRRLLKPKFEMGLFDNPYVDPGNINSVVNNEVSMAKGKEAQMKSIVLLKNEQLGDGSFVLPLQTNSKIYIENIDQDIAIQYADVVDNIDEADFAILRLKTPFEPRNGSFFESSFHQGYLDFQEPELSRILSITDTKPTIICIYMERPAVIPEISANTAGLLCDFGAEDDAFLDIVFGKHNPTAILPFDLPESMEAVEKQFEDVPFDTEDAVYRFGHGLSYN